MNARRRWTEEEDAVLRREAGKRTWREIAAMLGRSRFAATRRASELGIAGKASGYPWSAQELATLRQDFPNKTSAEVAAALGRGLSAINVKARELGLVKDPAHISRMQAQRAGVDRGPSVGRSALMGRPYRVRDFDAGGDYSPTQDAVRHLQRKGPIWRCRADGTTDPKGDHWKFCGRVMTAAEVEARAAASGWIAPAILGRKDLAA